MYRALTSPYGKRPTREPQSCKPRWRLRHSTCDKARMPRSSRRRPTLHQKQLEGLEWGLDQRLSLGRKSDLVLRTQFQPIEETQFQRWRQLPAFLSFSARSAVGNSWQARERQAGLREGCIPAIWTAKG